MAGLVADTHTHTHAVPLGMAPVCCLRASAPKPCVTCCPGTPSNPHVGPPHASPLAHGAAACSHHLTCPSPHVGWWHQGAVRVAPIALHQHWWELFGVPGIWAGSGGGPCLRPHLSLPATWSCDVWHVCFGGSAAAAAVGRQALGQGQGPLLLAGWARLLTCATYGMYAAWGSSPNVCVPTGVCAGDVVCQRTAMAVGLGWLRY